MVELCGVVDIARCGMVRDGRRREGGLCFLYLFAARSNTPQYLVQTVYVVAALQIQNTYSL